MEVGTILAIIFGAYVVIDIIADTTILIAMKRKGIFLYDVALFLRALFRR